MPGVRAPVRCKSATVIGDQRPHLWAGTAAVCGGSSFGGR